MSSNENQQENVKEMLSEEEMENITGGSSPLLGDSSTKFTPSDEQTAYYNSIMQNYGMTITSQISPGVKNFPNGQPITQDGLIQVAEARGYLFNLSKYKASPTKTTNIVPISKKP